MATERAEGDEALRRTAEEFFDLPADIRHIPLGAASLARDLSVGLESPELQAPFEKFLLEANRYSQINGLLILIDAFHDDVNLSSLASADVLVYVFGQMMPPKGQEEEGPDIEELLQAVENAQDLLDEGTEIRIRPLLVNLVTGDSFIPAATEFIRNLFHRNPQSIPFAIDEVREEPPSACFIVIVDPQPSI